MRSEGIQARESRERVPPYHPVSLAAWQAWTRTGTEKYPASLDDAYHPERYPILVKMVTHEATPESSRAFTRRPLRQVTSSTAGALCAAS